MAKYFRRRRFNKFRRPFRRIRKFYPRRRFNKFRRPFNRRFRSKFNRKPSRFNKFRRFRRRFRRGGRA